jgi:hypothetical protein
MSEEMSKWDNKTAIINSTKLSEDELHLQKYRTHGPICLLEGTGE